MRRALIASVLVALALAGSTSPVAACGCGAVLSTDRAAGDQPTDEWSLVRFDGRTETILMRLSLGAPLDRAALVLPVPHGATVALGRDDAFERTSELTAPLIEERTRYHLGFSGGGGEDGSGGVGAPTGGAPGVETVASQKLGPLRVVTLRSRSTRALEAWLRENRFPLPDGLSSGTQSYLDEGWDLLVTKLRPAAAGTPLSSLQPLAIRFPAARPVYPLRLSRLAEAGSTARVDLFAPWKVDVGGYGPVVEEDEVPASDRTGTGVFLAFAGRVSRAAAGGALRPITGPGTYLTSYRFSIDREFPDRDPAFTRADDQSPYRQVYVEYDDIYLADTIVPLTLAVLALGGAIAWGLRRRARRTPGNG